MRGWIPRLVAVSVSLLVTAVIVEIGFRVTAREPWYERLEEEQHDAFVVKQSVGEERFRLREALDRPPKEPGSYRILFLGDSFTYGAGVEDASRIFPSLVVAKLNEGGSRYELFNGGIPGSRTPAWVKLFQAAVGPYEPDLVVTVFFLRDGTRGVGGSRGAIRKIGKRMAELSEESWLFRHSRTYRYFRERRAQQELSREYLKAMHDGYLGEPEQTAEWERAQANLLAIRDEAEGRGAKFALVVFPVLFALGPDYPLEDVCLEIERFADEQGIPVLSLLPAFRGRHAPSLWVSPLDQHPNEQAHALAAEAITEFIAPMTTR
jgi:hypothetical protein